MFTNLIESDSHLKELKRRSSFFLGTVAAYSLILFAAGIASIYAYDARLETQSSGLIIDYWIPPVPTTHPQPARPRPPQPLRRSTPSSAPIDRNARVQERTIAIAPTTDPRSVPNDIGTRGPDVPPVTDVFRISNRNVDPPPLTATNATGCATCAGNDSRVIVNDDTPPPTVVKPQTQRLAPQVLVSKAISLPQPPYPPLARQIHLQGSVPVQILVDENGRVVSAHAVSGHPFLTRAAEEAALRARFTATTLNGQPVKVQGVITYNFVLQ